MEVLRYGYRIPFLCDPPPIQGSHLSAFVPPLVHQRGGAGRLFSGPCGQVRSGARSSAVSRLLQPAVRSVEDLRVLEAGYRSLDPQLVRGRSSLPHGDHPVCTAVSSSGRLDGLHRPQGSLPADPCPSGISSLPSVCCSGPSLPVLCPLLRPVHGPSGLLSGHGSCFSHSPLLGYPHEAVPRRLARPVLVSGSSPSRPPGRSQSLPGARDCSKPFQVSPSSISGCPIPRCRDRLPVFPGFSVRVSKLFSTADVFLSCAAPPASTWLQLLGILSSLAHLVPGGRLRVRSLQLCLHQQWDREDLSALILWSPLCRRDLQWWLDRPRLSLGVSLVQVSPDLDFWSDASDVGWGAHLGSLTASGLWDQEQAALSINARELLAVREGLHHFLPSLQGMAVSVFCDNSTAVSYLRKEGGTRSPFLNTLAQEILRWTESHSIRLLPQFIPGSLNVLADSLSRPHQLPHTEWSLHPEVFRSLSRLWLVQIDLFATSANRQCCLFFSPFRDPLAAGTDAFLQCWDGLQAYAFPPWSILPKVLAKLRVSGSGADADSPLLASTPLVCGPPSSVAGSSGGSAPSPRPPAPASVSLPLPGSPKASASCLATLRRFTRAAGFSSAVAAQASLLRRPSSRKAYQLKWQVYRQW